MDCYNGACPPSYILPVVPIAQEDSDWCSAACLQMVAAFHGRDMPQTAQTRGKSRRSWPRFAKLGFKYKMIAGKVLTPAAVKKQIQQRRPFLHSWRWSAGAGHIVVVCGYSTGDDGALRIHYIDPRGFLHSNGKYSARARAISYTSYQQGNGPATQPWREYYDIRPM